MHNAQLYTIGRREIAIISLINYFSSKASLILCATSKNQNRQL
ncbi:MAG TPA: hypothetical protein PKJ81_04425 [Bacteroidales bacterium]|nr:hypothetical protein [Bacteroidales bacterium]